jgi:nitrogen-specific signal transduction histidine kinase
MVVCPSCKSSQIREDHKPAPFLLRLIGICVLLCDNCNHQFKAFSLGRHKRGQRRHKKQNRNSFIDRPKVDLNLLRQKVAESQSEKANGINRIRLSLQPAASGEIVSGQVLPVRSELQTQVLKLHTPGLKQPLEKQQGQESKVADAELFDTPVLKAKHKA